MDCMQLQALYDSNDESSLNFENNNLYLNLNNNECEANINEQNNNEQFLNDSREKLTESKIYDKYTDALKLLKNKEYENCENVFIELLDGISILLNEREETPIGNEDSLEQLRYIIYKNLSTICSTYKNSLNESLEYLIKAVHIDSSDVYMWHQIGENALKLNKFLVSKHAFEQSLKIEPTYWPSLDNLIVLYYSIGDYSSCFKHTCEAISLDRYYTNGILILDLLLKLNHDYYTNHVNTFINNAMQMNEFDEILNDMPDECGHELRTRVDAIRSELKSQLNEIRVFDMQYDAKNEFKLEIDFNTVNSWKDAGDWILHVYNKLKDTKNRFNAKLIFEVTQKTVPVLEVEMEKITEEVDKPTESMPVEDVDILKAPAPVGEARVQKRRRIEPIFAEDFASKRRSLREKHNDSKANEVQTDTNISDIIKNYFLDIYISTPPVFSEYKSKSIDDSPSINTTVENLTDTRESDDVHGFFREFLSDSTVLIIMEKYLVLLGSKSNLKWPIGLCDTFVSLFDLLNSHYDFMEAIENQILEEDESIGIFKAIQVYIELQLSNVKERLSCCDDELQFKFDNEQKTNKIIFYLNKLHKYVNYFLMKHPDLAEHQLSDCSVLLVRCLCLQLYVNFNFISDSTHIGFFESNISRLLDRIENNRVLVPNSKVLNVITKTSLEEFRFISEKSKIFKMKNFIRNLYRTESYDELIRNLDVYIENFNVPYDDSNFDGNILWLLLDSCLKLKKFEKFLHLSTKLLYQLVNFYNKLTNIEINERKIEKYFRFLTKTIDSLFMVIKKQENVNVTDYVHKIVWIMYNLVLYFFENNETAFKFENIKPLKVFLILFYICRKETKYKVKYVISVHEYLARNSFCGLNNGEFIKWSIDTLLRIQSECETCNSTKLHEDGDNTNTKQTSATTSSSLNGGKCTSCDSCNDQIEQCFYCLFGYKKPRVKYISNHSVLKVDYTLENAVDLYKFFRPNDADWPEFDSMKKFSISTEYNEFLHQIVTLIENELNATETHEQQLLTLLYDEPFESLDENIAKLKQDTVNEYLNDAYYLIGDYYFKITKDYSEASKYFIKDLLYNQDRLDSWACLALAKSTVVLNDNVKQNQSIDSIEKFKEFEKQIQFSNNCFRKSLELSWNNNKLLVEYGTFSYQIAAHYSRQLKIENLFGDYFNADDLTALKRELTQKREEYLRQSLNAYKSADESTVVSEKNENKEVAKDACENENSNGGSNHSSTASSVCAVSQTGEKPTVNDDEDDGKEDWLYHYMFGKIKEKLSFDTVVCLKHYIQSLDYLHESGAKYLKRHSSNINTASQYLSFEAIEVIYRIYACVLKSLKKPTVNYNQLLVVLSTVVDKPFVKSHSDYDLEKVDGFLREILDQEKVDAEQKGSYSKCVAICIAGLYQILSRFPYHYRSIYRLAYFYAKSIDAKKLEFARDLLTGVSQWRTVQHMPCQGLFHDKKQLNFFNGIWLIPIDDIERSGNFPAHLFNIVYLLIDVYYELFDSNNLIDLTRRLYQNDNPGYTNDGYELCLKRKAIEGLHIDILANFGLIVLVNVLTAKLDYLSSEPIESDIISALMESYETQKLIVKYLQSETDQIKNILIRLYLLLKPEFANRMASVTTDEVIRFCISKEKQDRSAKIAASRSKNKAPASNTAVTVPPSVEPPVEQLSQQTVVNSTTNNFELNDVVIASSNAIPPPPPLDLIGMAGAMSLNMMNALNMIIEAQRQQQQQQAVTVQNPSQNVNHEDEVIVLDDDSQENQNNVSTIADLMNDN